MDCEAIFRALGDETRLKIFMMLSGKELCVCDIWDGLEVSQPTISHHLRIMKQAGIITDTREGKWVYYRLCPEALRAAGEFLLAACPATAPVRARTCCEEG